MAPPTTKRWMWWLPTGNTLGKRHLACVWLCDAWMHVVWQMVDPDPQESQSCQWIMLIGGSYSILGRFLGFFLVTEVSCTLWCMGLWYLCLGKTLGRWVVLWYVGRTFLCPIHKTTLGALLVCNQKVAGLRDLHEDVGFDVVNNLSGMCWFLRVCITPSMFFYISYKKYSFFFKGMLVVR